MMASLVAPELAVQDDEAKEFLAAASRVMRHYDIRSTQLTLDWIAFAGIGGAMYGGRLLAINIRKRAEKQAVPSPAPQPVSNGASRPGDTVLHPVDLLRPN